MFEIKKCTDTDYQLLEENKMLINFSIYNNTNIIKYITLAKDCIYSLDNLYEILKGYGYIC